MLLDVLVLLRYKLLVPELKILLTCWSGLDARLKFGVPELMLLAGASETRQRVSFWLGTGRRGTGLCLGRFLMRQLVLAG